MLDSSGYLALVSTRDTHHQAARTGWTQLTEERWSTFTTNFIIAEAHALFLVRLGRSRATAFLRQLALSSTNVVRVTPTDEDRARTIIYQYEDKDFSLTDAASFAAMERLGIGTAFTSNRNFAQYGFRVLPVDQPS